MVQVHLKHLISFSSQDPVSCAENLIHNSSGTKEKPWLCSKDDKSGLLEAEFELERASYINYIDIGNCGSSTIEIMVGRSSGPRNSCYVSLLPAVTFMSLSEVKSGENYKSLRMFKSDDFTKSAVNEKWDRVKIICGQPYRKGTQFGISYIRFGSNKVTETTVNGLRDSQNFTNRSSALVRYEGAKRPFPNNGVESRGRQLLNSSLSNSPASQNKRKKMSISVSPSFQIDALKFLTADFDDNLFEESRSFEDYMNEFAKLRKMILTDVEKDAFRIIYNNYVESSTPMQENRDISSTLTNGICQKSTSNRNHTKTDTQQSYSTQETDVEILDFRTEKTLQKRNGLHNTNGYGLNWNGRSRYSSQLNAHQRKSSNSDDSEGVPDIPRFDLEMKLSPKALNHRLSNGNKRAKLVDKTSTQSRGFLTNGDKYGKSADEHRLTQYRLSNGDQGGSKHSDNTPTQDKVELSNGESSTDPEKTPTQFKVGFLRPEDFIQFDGIEPTTSKGVTYVDCPICGDPFHTSEIETHAAYCGTPEYENNVIIRKNRQERKSSQLQRGNLIGKRETLVECPVCGNYFDQEEVHGHTNVCIENCIA